MRNDRAAHAYLHDAEIIVGEVQESLRAGHYHRVVRKCQEGAELAIKGLFHREPAFYGSPEGVPAGELFEREDAEEALVKAGRVLSIVRDAFARYRQAAT